jgi:Fe(3+) dicitrate transport protein
MRWHIFSLLSCFSFQLLAGPIGNDADTLKNLESNLSRETHTISVVVGGENDFMGGASVRLLNTNFEGVTNSKGVCVLRQVPANTYTIEVRFIGYKIIREKVDIDAANTSFTYKLETDPFQLLATQVIIQRDHLFKNIPGSVKVTPKEELDRIQPVTANEILRRTPGLHVVDEEGAGLRLNIGVRGLDPDRSRKVLILEDGVPVALNPYGEPEMYYSPSIDRMQGVEVIKGSGQILYGPQSVGGVINFITAEPPIDQEAKIKLQAGEGGYSSLLAQYGNTYDNTGVQVTYLRKQADNMAGTQFLLNDLNAKVRIPLSRRSVLGVKVSAYNENSNATYLGMTQSMFDQRTNDFEFIAPNDNLDVRRFAMSANHRYIIGNGWNIQSTFFANTTTRDWRRQDFVNNAFDENGNNILPNDFTGMIWGDTTVAGGAILMRDRTGNRNRTFQVAGFEQKLTYDTIFSQNLEYKLHVGYRYMLERAFEQRINGSTAEAISGQLINDEVRTGNAISAYILNQIKVGKYVEVSPGLRFEDYMFEREIFRQSSRDTLIDANNRIQTFIPGVGAVVFAHANLNLFGGVHRGYSPPRVKDAIDFSFANPVLDIDAEKSWNYELGLRTKIAPGVKAELTYFHLDFENQVIAASESGGQAFGVVNAGATLNRGVEASLEANFRDLLNTSWLILFDAQATFLRATFNESRLVNGQDIRGNRLPYAPDLTASAGLTAEAPFGTGLRFTFTHVGEQFTNDINSSKPSNNGRFGKIDAFSLLDFGVYHHIRPWKTRVNIAVKNITNERYIATRRPQGISIGLPRFITAGVEVQL